MIKGSIQKAVIQLEDKKDNSQRPMERIKILHNLLFHPQSSGRCEERELEMAPSHAYGKKKTMERG